MGDMTDTYTRETERDLLGVVYHAFATDPSYAETVAIMHAENADGEA